MLDKILQRKLELIETEVVPNQFTDMDLYNFTHPQDGAHISFPYREFTPFEIRVVEDSDQSTREVLETYAENMQAIGKEVNVESILPNRERNVSGNQEHPSYACNVTFLVYKRDGWWYVSNSHAGTHADQPSHWANNPEFDRFDIRQYNGGVKVVDISEYVSAGNEICPDVLDHAGLEKNDSLYRIIFLTRRNAPSDWEDITYLTADTVNAILELYPNLVMYGTDAPSVDQQNASPIIHHSHGAFWKQRVALLEGLKLENLHIGDFLNGYLDTKLTSIEEATGVSGVRDSMFAKVDFYKAN